jgi:transcriptional antiterminator NusG
MQKNWYIVYTKSKCEKKVITFFGRKGMETFCPMSYTKVKSFRRDKTVCQPIFKSYVFLRMTEEETHYVKQMDEVISILYWKGKPAVINKDEIEAIKEFTFVYNNVEIEKTTVNTIDLPSIVDGPQYSIEGTLLSLKTKTVKLYLPSLGYIMISKMEEDESIFGRETILLRNNSFSRS